LEKKFLGKCKWDENRMIVGKCGGYEYSSPPPTESVACPHAT
jgi:hypothetical protein